MKLLLISRAINLYWQNFSFPLVHLQRNGTTFKRDFSFGKKFDTVWIYPPLKASWFNGGFWEFPTSPVKPTFVRPNFVLKLFQWRQLILEKASSIGITGSNIGGTPASSTRLREVGQLELVCDENFHLSQLSALDIASPASYECYAHLQSQRLRLPVKFTDRFLKLLRNVGNEIKRERW